jgi:hypothetical protein
MLYERFDAGYDDNGVRDTLGSWYCVLAYRESSYVESMTFKSSGVALELQHGYIIGLILELAKESPRTFRRIGMFTHAWGAGTPDDAATHYPEFFDVEDPSTLHREEVVII